MQLSIIVPVYNVEQYIRPCVQSIFRQGLSEETFEVILVNDGTPDKSIEMIDDIVNLHNNIKILTQENQGLSMARNNGLLKATGRYVMFLDSDDLIVDNTLPKLLAYTENKTVDLVITELIKMTDADIESFTGNVINDEMTELKSAKDAFLYDFNPKQCYSCRILYRRQFLIDNKLSFIPGIYFEDVPFTTECYLKANTCIKSSLITYIYRQRENSIVASINPKKILDFNIVLAKLWDIYKQDSYPIEIQRQLMNTIFTTFSISVWYISHNQQLLSKRREIVYDLWQKVPDLCFTNGIKQKTISFLYRVAPCFYIKLRSLLS